MRKVLSFFCVATTTCSLAFGAQAFGDKPVKMIVPAPPGGSMDIVARVVGQQLSSDIGQPVVVENKPGAAGTIGMQALLQAPADGNTLLMGASLLIAEVPHVIKVPYDPLKDFIPLAVVSYSGVVLVANANNPALDFKSLVNELKARKGKTSFATYSAGTVSQYAGEILNEKEHLDMQHVPFAGSPPALQSLLGGQVDIMFDGMATSLPLIKSGKLRAYAFTGPKRSRSLPDVPSVLELGEPELNFLGWLGVIGSSKLPAAEVAKIEAAMKKAASAPDVQKKLTDVGLEPDVNVDSAALARELQEMSDRNAAIVKKFNIKLQ